MSSSPTEPGLSDSNHVEVTMPETGSAAEAVLVSWLRRPGDQVAEGEAICLVRVGEFEAEVVSPAEGVVAVALVEPGAALAVSASLAEVRIAAAEPEPVAMVTPPPTAPAPVELATFLSPAVQRLAAKYAVDVRTLAGNGRDGRISAHDVRSARN